MGDGIVSSGPKGRLMKAGWGALVATTGAWLLGSSLVPAQTPQTDPQASGRLAKLAILGTDAPAHTVALFARGFPQGELRPGDLVGLQRADDHRPLPTQMNPVTHWPDGSVKVALLAVEAPALEKGAVLECLLVKAPQAEAGLPLDLSALLMGRTAALTIRPKDGPPWTFDFVAAAKASTDRWHNGPLAVSTRVETKVPPERLGGVTSVRLVADVIVTKDGILELDWRLANDAVRKVGGGPARYAYEVSIAGQPVYTQAQATQIQYTAWVRRRGRAAGGPMPERPLIRPDYDVLVRGGFTLPWDRALPPAARTYIQGLRARCD